MQTSSTVKLTPDRRLFFDFVKAVGIIGIFAFHFYDIYLGEGNIKKLLDYGVLRFLLSNAHTSLEYIFVPFLALFSFGSIGVELFIIASGFGLYYSHLTHKISWKIFFRKRLIRIMPLYYFFLLIIFLLNVLLLKSSLHLSPEGLKSLGYHLLLLQTFNSSFRFFGFLFFVAIIFHLYLIFPVLTKMIRSERQGIAAFLFSLLLTPAFNWIFSAAGFQFKGILLTDYIPFFLFGMLIARSLFDSGRLNSLLFDLRAALIFLLLAAATVWLTSYVFEYNKGFRMLIAFSFFCGLPFIFSLLKKLPVRPLIDFISYTSYPFYLLHMIVIKLSLIYMPAGLLRSYQSWIFAGICMLAVTALASYGIQRGYDRILKVSNS